MRKIRNRSVAGETITETLVSLLICVLASLLLFSTIDAVTRMNAQAARKFDETRTEAAIAAGDAQAAEAAKDQGDEPKKDGTITYVYPTNKQVEYDVTYHGNDDVVSYSYTAE